MDGCPKVGREHQQTEGVQAIGTNINLLGSHCERTPPRISPPQGKYCPNGIRRRIGISMRLGYAIHATQEGILEEDSQRLTPWRTIENAGCKQANLRGTKVAS